jgi:hypothetical protein
MDDEREDDYEPGSFGDLNSGGTEAENPGSTSAGDCFKRRVLVATAAPEQWITKFVIWLRQMNSLTGCGVRRLCRLFATLVAPADRRKFQK